MTRAEAAAFVGGRYLAYLLAVTRAAADTAGNLKEAIDDSLRALGYTSAEIPTAEPTDAWAEEDLRVQVAYRAMAQISRDLGATSFDISTGGDSFKLSQLRTAAQKDLELTQAAVLERFGTLGVAIGDSNTPFVTIDLDFLTLDPLEVVV